MEGPYLKPFIKMGGIDLSARAFSLTWNYEVNAVPMGAYGDTDNINKGGWRDWAVNIQMNAEFSSAVDGAIFDLVGSSTVVVLWSPRSTDTVSATNPRYSGTALLQSFSPAEGDWGERAVFTLSLMAAGTLTRSTSS